MSDAKETLNLLNDVMRVAGFWWHTGDTSSPIIRMSCKQWITYDTLACCAIYNRRSARILNSFWADVKPIVTVTQNNSSNPLKAAAATSQCHLQK